MKEKEAVLAAVFGDGWEMFLIAEGVVGGTEDADIHADRERVYELARQHRPELDADVWSAAQDAWFRLWADSPPDEPAPN